jgi:hypothetical protein
MLHAYTAGSFFCRRYCNCLEIHCKKLSSSKEGDNSVLKMAGMLTCFFVPAGVPVAIAEIEDTSAKSVL